MSHTYISGKLRRLVSKRAKGLCEYCLVDEAATYWGCEIDHIISEKHGGPTTEDNLAYSCLTCNRSKGSDIGSLVPGIDRFVRFYNPRKDLWYEHFELQDGIRIAPLTEIGLATESILGFNTSERILERRILSQKGRFPSEAARDQMRL